jgi:hypothetical protein
MLKFIQSYFLKKYIRKDYIIFVASIKSRIYKNLKNARGITIIMESVEDYIKKQKSPQKEICTKLRESIFEIFPQAKEEIKWGVPSYNGGLYYIVALKDHVNLGFSIEGQKIKNKSAKISRKNKYAAISYI